MDSFKTIKCLKSFRDEILRDELLRDEILRDEILRDEILCYEILRDYTADWYCHTMRERNITHDT